MVAAVVIFVMGDGRLLRYRRIFLDVDCVEVSVKLIVTVVIDFKDVVLETQRFPRFGAGITTVPTNSIEVGGLGVCFCMLENI